MESNVEETNTAPAAEETAPVRRRASRRVTAAAGATSEAATAVSAPAEAAAPAEAPAAEAPAAPAADAGEAPAEAPKKRATRSRKKVAEEAPAETAAEAPAAEAPAAAATAPAEAAEDSEAAPAKRGRSRRAQASEAAPQADTANDAPAENGAEQTSEGSQSRGLKPAQGGAAQGEAPAEAAKADADGENEKGGRGRNRRTRGQKNENGESAETAEQSDETKGRGQNQGGDKNGQNGQNGQGKGDSASRSTRTRQRDRKRRGQNDDLEPEITEDDVLLPVAGILDVLDNYAFVRTSGYLPGTSDVYVSLGQVKKYGLRRGDAVVGAIRQPREGDAGGRQKYNAIVKVDTVNGRTAEENEQRADIADLTPVFPQERLRFETAQDRQLGRAIDIAAPVGLGQRGLLVLPASAHGTSVLVELAQAVTANRPDAHLMVVLANAQPEEITHLQRTIAGEVVAASFDRPAEDQATVAELAIDRAKRLVELGHDVVVLVDSLNRFARAYAQAQHASARPALDEIDEFALGQIKRLLAAARNVENAGSLTVLATVQTKTGIDADKMLLREARAIANSEIRFEKGAPGAIPAVDLASSLTRNVDAMLGADEAAVLAGLRTRIAADDEAAEQLAERLRATASNAALLAELQRGRA
ncbi:transcription termination factor Rho [Leucobacter chironomi]|uniref:transcription termination factor Rho n=1 Tax=Leucobacter chironomi TaxID=491918 RepID=UPI000412AD94|nr:transcription termination factor Rho [Leucobacter chironomi]